MGQLGQRLASYTFPVGHELRRPVSGCLIFVMELSCVQVDFVSQVVNRVRPTMFVGLNTLPMLSEKQFVMSDALFEGHAFGSEIPFGGRRLSEGRVRS